MKIMECIKNIIENFKPNRREGVFLSGDFVESRAPIILGTIGGAKLSVVHQTVMQMTPEERLAHMRCFGTGVTVGAENSQTEE